MNPKESHRGADRPNVLYLMTDQHCAQALGCAGHPLVQTPNIDALAEEGVFFENCYCPSPVCGPARASLFAGHFPGQTGVTGNHQQLRPHIKVLPAYLQEAGMKTALFGKLHLTPFDKPWGFEYRKFNDSMVNTYGKGEADASDYVPGAAKAMGISPEEFIKRFEEDEESPNWYRFYMGSNIAPESHHYNKWIADESIEFLRNHRDNRPFFMFGSFFGPHQPMLAPEPWASMYDPADVELIPQFNVDPSDKPILKNKRAKSPPRPDNWDEATWRKVLAAYYGQISQIDHYIGRIIQALKRFGVYDNTVIILTSDHGDHMGYYRMLSKGSMYDNSAKVPLIIRDPAARPSRGQRRAHVVNNLDLYRTILRRCGLDAPDDSPSRDLTPILQDAAAPWTQETRSSLKNQSMIRRENWKIMRADMEPDCGNPLYELYDLSETPREMVNRYNDPKAAKIRQELQHDLDRWHLFQHAEAARVTV